MSAIDNPYKMLQLDYLLRIMTAPNAGAHNAVYRGKALGGEATAAQWAAIAAGSFDDLYIGDYWTKNGVNYRIAAFNYFCGLGDTYLPGNHVVVVPDSNLYETGMNTTNTTVDGYVGTLMYKSGLNDAKATIKAAFGEHIVKHRIPLTTASSNGVASADAFYDSEVELMCLSMVFGTGAFAPVSMGAVVPKIPAETTQLPLFRLAPQHILSDHGRSYALRDIITDTRFAYVSWSGNPDYYSLPGNAFGVRPYFLIG